MVDRFNQSQKDVVVENQFQGSYEETGQKLTAALQAKQAPDVSVLSDVWWFKFYLNKAISPLDDLLKANNIDKADYVDAFVNEGTRKGQLVLDPVRPQHAAVLLQQGRLEGSRPAGSRPRDLGTS